MSDSGHRRWLGAAILVGATYAAVSIISGALAPTGGSRFMLLFWRWGAFIVSGVVFVAHIGFEHARLHSRPPTTAWHASVAAALGGLGIALAANLHDLASASGYRPRMAIALVVWPLLTGGAAFVLALAIAAVLGMKRSATG